MMFIASVSTVIFNGNPLLRFDGYYILSDLLDIPNLATRARGHLRHMVERYVFGYKESFSPSQSFKEAIWMSIFGVLSGIYRVVVFTGIILFVADKFLLAGIAMALMCVISWGVVPLFRLVAYLASSPRLARTRLRAVTISIGSFAVLVAFLAIIPFPNRFRAPGVMEAVQYIRVVNDAPGYVQKVLAPSGTEVRPGTALMELQDRELEFEIEATLAQQDETLALQMRAMNQEVADLEPIRKRLETIEAKLKDLLKQRAALLVRARESGTWVAPRNKEMVGTWIPRGTALGEIVPEGTFRFSAVVSQDEAADLFVDQIQRAEVRVYGQGGKNLKVEAYQIIPFQHEKLPSAALGWLGGGEVAVDPAVAFLHGRSGKLRFSLHPKPLLMQWGHKFRQLLQRRYQI
jgi:putative peptide zinc metalloprotease protein